MRAHSGKENAMRFLAAGLAVALCAPLASAQETTPAPQKQVSKTPLQQYNALAKKYTDARRKYFRAYRKATKAERRQMWRTSYPRARDYAAPFWKLAQAHPGTPGAVKALVWLAQNVRRGFEGKKALAVLLKDHLDEPALARLAWGFRYRRADGRKVLRQMLKSPNRKVQAAATYHLAGNLMRTQPKEATALLEKLAKDYPKSTFAKRAKGDLYELRNLSIGKVAPEIDGEDLQGVKMKLSDYRGKVVFLDFWGDW